MSRHGASDWIRPEIRALSAYHVPAAEGLVKLDANENPYAWPGPLVEAWLDSLRALEVNRYPDPQARGLNAALRAAWGVPAQASLVLGNGSDELIQMLALAVGGPGRILLAPEPTFVVYRLVAAIAGMDYVGVPLRADFALDMAAMRHALVDAAPALVFLARPNNPTGSSWARADVEEILALAPGAVVIDEAYAPFASDSFITASASRDNLLVMRTLSKLGLAGLRLGALAGPADWLEQLDKLRLPYNINSLTQASAGFALSHADELDRQAARIRQDRQALLESLSALEGIEVFPSEANFLLLRAPAGRARVIDQSLRAQGVLVKSFSGEGPLAQCLRVTVGRPEENTRFIEALRRSLDRL